MSTKIYPVDCLPDRILLGRQTENGVRQVRIDCQPWLAQWPDLNIDIWVTPAGGAESYPANATLDGDILEWTITSADTACAGDGTMEVVGLLDGIKTLSAVAMTYVTASTTAVPGTTPEAYQGWVDQVLAAGAEAKDSAELAAASEERATAAADRAVLAKERAENFAEDAADMEAKAAESADLAQRMAEDALAAVTIAANSASAAEGSAQSAQTTYGFAMAEADKAAASAEAAQAVLDSIPPDYTALAEAAKTHAPAIVAEAVNAVATCTDAAARDAVAVVSIIEADVSGTADPVAGTVATITPRTAVHLYHAAAYDESVEAVMTADLPEAVYGGKLDWVTGVLTVTHAMLDVAAKTWKASSTTAERFVATHKTASLVAGTHYPAAPGSAYDNAFFRSSGSQIAVNTNYTTLDEWTAYLAAQKAAGTPVMLLYELQEADRYTIQLTTHQLTMLRGSNAVWSDTGYTDVAYVADTKTYVDDRVSAWERTGLTIAALGDSIMAGDGNSTVGIGEILAERIGGTCWEYAKGGATIIWDTEDAASTSELTKRQNILYQADLLIAEHATAPDIILLNGGTNDISTGATPLGEVTATYEDELDTSTFAGAMESLIKRLKNAYPGSVILYIRAHRMGSRSNVRQRTFGEMAVEICDKWSVGLVDIYNRSGLNTWMSAYHQYTYKADKTHPTQEGYERFYIPLILAEVKRHIGEV